VQGPRTRSRKPIKSAEVLLAGSLFLLYLLKKLLFLFLLIVGQSYSGDAIASVEMFHETRNE